MQTRETKKHPLLRRFSLSGRHEDLEHFFLLVRQEFQLVSWPFPLLCAHHLQTLLPDCWVLGVLRNSFLFTHQSSLPPRIGFLISHELKGEAGSL